MRPLLLARGHDPRRGEIRVTDVLFVMHAANHGRDHGRHRDLHDFPTRQAVVVLGKRHRIGDHDLMNIRLASDALKSVVTKDAVGGKYVDAPGAGRASALRLSSSISA